MTHCACSVRLVWWCVVGTACLGCGNSSTPQSVTCSAPGGAVAGAPDSHCAAATPFDPAACHVDAATPTDGGIIQYGAAMNGSEGDDDDCKYHLSWTSTPVCKGNSVTFTVNVTAKSTGAPVTGADINTDVFLTPIHPAPLTDTKTVQDGGGKYEVGPIRFDASGKWTVRFHLFPTCDDTTASPHGHAAFFIDVP